MHNIYQNLQWDRQVDFVSVSVEGTLVLERLSDELCILDAFPEFLNQMLSEKLPAENYDVYQIFTLGVQNHSRISDYKKIWGLGDFDRQGIYDGFFDTPNQRIYFGICKNACLDAHGFLVGEVTLCLPKGAEFLPGHIFDFFAKEAFDIQNEVANRHRILSDLQKTIRNSVVIDRIRDEKYHLNLYGTGIGQMFDAKKSGAVV